MGPKTYADAKALILQDFPHFKEVRKSDSGLMKFIGAFLRIVTFGGMKSFMDSFTTTIGTTVYTPSSWDSMDDAGRCIVLRHERVHMVQKAHYGMWLFTLMYLIPIFPIGFAWFRAAFEMEAYGETITATLELRGAQVAMAPEFKARMVSRFTGPSYLWMWPFPDRVGEWFDTALDLKVRAFLKEGK